MERAINNNNGMSKLGVARAHALQTVRRRTASGMVRRGISVGWHSRRAALRCGMRHRRASRLRLACIGDVALRIALRQHREKAHLFTRRRSARQTSVRARASLASIGALVIMLVNLFSDRGIYRASAVGGVWWRRRIVVIRRMARRRHVMALAPSFLILSALSLPLFYGLLQFVIFIGRWLTGLLLHYIVVACVGRW